MTSNSAALLLIGFGGPEHSGEIRPFLDRVLVGHPIPPARYEEVVRHYEAIGGRSPYNDLTRGLASSLRDALRRRGCALPVAIGFRNTQPGVFEALREPAAKRADRVFAFILSAFRCDASWDRYQREIAAACTDAGLDPSRILYPPPWHSHPDFIAAAADLLRIALADLGVARDSAEVIFTAHSIPLAMDSASGYSRQFRESAELVTRASGLLHWSLAYQSRSGNPRDPWLEPDINSALRANQRAKIVMPLGFLCDHVEVLYDLDILAAATARNDGITMVRAATVGAHPKFVAMIEELALAALNPAD